MQAFRGEPESGVVRHLQRVLFWFVLYSILRVFQKREHLSQSFFCTTGGEHIISASAIQS